MPEMSESVTDGLERLLKDIEECSLNTNICNDIVKALETDHNGSPQVIEKLLEACIQDPKDVMKNAVDALNIVCIVIKKVMTGEYTSKPDLLPSMRKILHMIKTTIYSSKSDEIKVLYFEALLSYPDEVFVKFEEDHYNEVMELFNLYFHQRIPIEIRIQSINILHKYLKVLPPDKRFKFVKEGIDFWFLKLVPSVMTFSTTPNFKIESSLEALEIVANELLHVDYIDNPNWQIVLQCIYTPQKYPAVMKNLLEKGSDIWHRLWIVFIKMLKSQITKNSISAGSPINSMLPVVESAFKMDVTNRCRAFCCWNVLIDNFATETIEVYINKRIKLLLIPLCSNNAKVEDTALAKLKTWWHLISRFHTKLKKFSDVILIPFLQFCFGKAIVSNKPVFVPGLLSTKTKEHCVEAFVNILGHHNCEGCVTLPKLSDKLINTKYLVDNWKDLLYFLNVAIKITANSPSKLRRPFKCAWISFVNIICSLPDNNVKKDLFHKLLTMLEDLIKDCCVEGLSDIVLNDFILSLFNGDANMKQLLKLQDDDSSTIHKIVSIMLHPSFENLYKSCDMTNAVVKLKPFANFVVDHFETSITIFLKEVPVKCSSLVLWTAFTTSVCEKKLEGSQNLCEMLLWPLKNVDFFTKVEFSTSQWHILYGLTQAKIDTNHANEEILKALKSYKNINSTNSSFLLKVAIVLLMQKITSDNGVQYEEEVDLVQHITSKVHSLHLTHPVFTTLVDILPEIFKKLSNYVNLNIAQQVLSIIKIIFMLILPEFKKSSKLDADLLLKVERLLKSIEQLLKLEAYAPLKEIISTELIDCAPYFGQEESLKVTIVGTLYILLSGMDNNNPSVNVIKKVIDSLKQEDYKEITKFTTPGKILAKKTKKKETSIVNTVVDNGEEFVVVKSNWKFNPKKLTDKQKEKFQRQREDIPALYQDLSQSQDEFKLSNWKTDSQDTTTSSKSNSLNNKVNEEVSSILKNMPNTDVVPKILKNILIENNDKGSSPDERNEDLNKTESPSNKEIRTPRLALKDRIFRNVRNLIEKSNVENGDKEIKSSTNDCANTPIGISIKTSNAIIHSVPSDINLDRPSRLRRKPKKFEDLQVFSLKKRRFSLGNNDSQNEHIYDESTDIQDLKKESENDQQIDSPLVTISENQENKPTHMAGNSIIHDVAKDINNKNILNDDKNVGIINSETNKSCKSEVVIEINDSSQINIDENNENVAVNDSAFNIGMKEKKSDQPETKEINVIHKPSNGKTMKKKSRIEKELAIDMVNPFLPVQSEKRRTRKNTSESPNVTRRKSLSVKLNKSKSDLKNTPKADKKIKAKDKVVVLGNESQNILPDSQNSCSSQDVTGSQDIIESSQDSTVSVMSVKSTKNLKRIPIVALENINVNKVHQDKSYQEESSSTVNKTDISDSIVSICEINDDSEFPFNKSTTDHVQIDLTANMDTELIEDMNSDEVIVIKDDDEPPISIPTEDTFIEMDTQDIADADTQPIDPNTVIRAEVIIDTPAEETQSLDSEKIPEEARNESNVDNSELPIQDDSTRSLTESLVCATKDVDKSSSTLSLKNEEQRKQDFINNTIEISPIKTLSPVRDNKSPSPETSSDYLVIKLSSPVQNNGEPYEKCDSPEIFTEDKVSPDKRDQSPPREEVHVTNASPKSLSLKKNKPQVRTGGRAAQMLGLCVAVPDRLQTIMNSEKVVETEEPKKSSPLNTSARRNLRILYNSTNENCETPKENEDNFLKLKRSLPAPDSSPSVPILKRKLDDIIDDTTVSPASKRKRVSFHDPPVVTTICVKKYIEPCGVRSPQNSTAKRQERQLRAQLSVNLKSPKRLDTVFKLDTALNKAVESFTESTLQTHAESVTPSTNEDSEMISPEQTPVAELVKNSELNDIDPICIELIDCKDPIDNIAGDLSSSAMRPLLVKEFAGQIETVGDLAKMTELAVNRLCIKAPKVEVTRKILNEYAKIKIPGNEITPTLETALNDTTVFESKTVNVEMQTDCAGNASVEVQTEVLATSLVSTQTDRASSAHCSIQTDESGCKTTGDIVTSLLEKSDFCERLNEQLDVPTKQRIADNLPLNPLMDILIQKISFKESITVLDRLLEKHTQGSLNGLNDNPRLSFLLDYLSERFSSKELILFCSDLLKMVHDKKKLT